MWKRFAPQGAIGKAFQLEYAVKRIILWTEEQKNKRIKRAMMKRYWKS